MKDLFIARWRQFSPKEQSILTALLFLTLSLLLYAFVWIPVQQGRERLGWLIPEKKAKLLVMRSQAADIEGLRGQFNSVRSQSGGLKAAVEVSAKLNGLILIYAPSAQNNDVSRLEVTLKQVTFDAWLKWVESLQTQHHVRLQSCRIRPDASRGLVNIDAVFTALG